MRLGVARVDCCTTKIGALKTGLPDRVAGAVGAGGWWVVP